VRLKRLPCCPPAPCRDIQLREQNLGHWTGRDIATIATKAPDAYRDWRAGRFAPDGAETWDTFRTRVASALEDAASRARQAALAVCHGDVIRAALEATLDLAPSRIIPVGAASLTVIVYSDGLPQPEAFNVCDQDLELDAPDWVWAGGPAEGSGIRRVRRRVMT